MERGGAVCAGAGHAATQGGQQRCGLRAGLDAGGPGCAPGTRSGPCCPGLGQRRGDACLHARLCAGPPGRGRAAVCGCPAGGGAAIWPVGRLRRARAAGLCHTAARRRAVAHDSASGGQVQWAAARVWNRGGHGLAVPARLQPGGGVCCTGLLAGGASAAFCTYACSSTVSSRLPPLQVCAASVPGADGTKMAAYCRYKEVRGVLEACRGPWLGLGLAAELLVSTLLCLSVSHAHRRLTAWPTPTPSTASPYGSSKISAAPR